MGQGGVAMRDVAAFLGHNDERTTAKAYAHLDVFEEKCEHLY
jgi:integrase